MRLAIPLLACVLTASAAHAQWLNYPTPGLPRTKDGKPILTAPAPKTPDGKPDLSGVWHVQPSGLAEMKRLFGNDVDTVQVPGMEIDTVSKYGVNVLADFAPGQEPVRNEAAGAITARNHHPSGLDTLSRCLPAGLPVGTLLSEFTKIVQTPGLTLIMHELDNATRQIYTDGRPLPKDPNPAWLGYSIGRWEKDTLVLDTVGLNDKSWLLQAIWLPHTEKLHIIERYTRPDLAHLNIDVTIEDPDTFVKPVERHVQWLFTPGEEIFEAICAENNKFLQYSAVK